ncbi:Asp-tRNA(Asn)/Glu-tRNA(Gln) amidotransferase subunit GatC [Patescibacteria group bacterium]
MPIDKKQIDHLCKLARLTIKDKQEEKFQKQLLEIVDYFEKLNKINTEKIKPTVQTTGLLNITREDKVDQSLSQKEVLQNAPDKQEGFFKVKSILE